MLKNIVVSTVLSHELIERKIYMLRGKKVMLDQDLANLYEVETRALNQAVRRNMDRFPSDFMIQLTREEIRNLSQIVISLKHSPNVFAFTEPGVAMLSSVLHSKKAVQVNIQIIRTFIRLRDLLSTHTRLQRKITAMEKKYDDRFKTVFEIMKELMGSPPHSKKKLIGFHVKY